VEYIVIKGHAEDNYKAIGLCADALCNAGCVTEDFKNNCIDREKNFPTGLPFEMPVAMPHSKSSAVNKDAICLLILDKPVTFYRMDEETEKLDAKMVFNLAITNPNGHIKVLQNLMKTFSSSGKLEDLYNSTEEEAQEKLKSFLSDSVAG
jgi:PTS system galactitol-specific IIA component